MSGHHICVVAGAAALVHPDSGCAADPACAALAAVRSYVHELVLWPDGLYALAADGRPRRPVI